MQYLNFFLNIFKKHPELLQAILVALLEELKTDPGLVLKLLGLIKVEPTQ